jgi:hypothetical protein
MDPNAQFAESFTAINFVDAGLGTLVTTNAYSSRTSDIIANYGMTLPQEHGDKSDDICMADI